MLLAAPHAAVSGAPADAAAAGTEADPEHSTTIASGRAPGDYVPTFYVRAVTGPLRNKSVCYVCRHGDRPVVMILLRQVGPELKSLFRNVDRLVERNRASGLKSFGVLLSDEGFPATGRVQTFAFENRIATPLCVAGEAVASPTCQNVHSDAAVTIVLYRDRRVIATHSLRPDELAVARYRPVIESVKRLAAEAGF
ncbi:MAG: hypothetical protein KY476_04730 [Planctomycetes bacterium]|nr:hypothetical protein [Planctomycetota bacterium]